MFLLDSKKVFQVFAFSLFPQQLGWVASLSLKRCDDYITVSCLSHHCGATYKYPESSLHVTPLTCNFSSLEKYESFVERGYGHFGKTLARNVHFVRNEGEKKSVIRKR